MNEGGNDNNDEKESSLRQEIIHYCYQVEFCVSNSGFLDSRIFDKDKKICSEDKNKRETYCFYIKPLTTHILLSSRMYLVCHKI